MQTLVQNRQTQLLGKCEHLGLPVFPGSVISPYFRKAGRVIHLAPILMTVKYTLQEMIAGGNSAFLPFGSFADIDTDTHLTDYFSTINGKNYDDYQSMMAAVYAAIVARAGVLGYTGFTEADIIDLSSHPITKQKFFSAEVAGGVGEVTFFTDTVGDGSGDALYPSLTSDQLACFVDGVSDQYAFPTITVAGNKKSVTVDVQKQEFSTGLAGILNVLTGASYSDAADGLVVKMIVGIDD